MTPDYQLLFTNSKSADCEVTNCYKRETGCGALSTDSKVQINSGGQMSALETEINGYSFGFCYECEVTTILDPSLKYFKNKEFTIN